MSQNTPVSENDPIPPKEHKKAGAVRGRSWRFALWLLTAPLAAGLTLAARHIPGFAEWYAVTVYPLLAQPLNALTGLVPISMMEVGCAVLIAGLLALGVRLAAVLCRLQGLRARLVRAARALVRLGCLASAGLLAFTLLCGVNYHRSTFAVHSGLPVQQSTVAELRELCSDLAARANALAAVQPHHDEAGVTLMTADGWASIADAADAAYGTVAARYPVLGGSYGHAKPMLASFVMSRMELTGIFFPFTMESNVNKLAPSYNLPFTIAHELAHLRGFMREDEANYIAWLVCSASPDVRLQYSGTVLALVHAGNALARADMQAYAELWYSYSEQLHRDLAANRAYWAQFEDKPLAELGEKTNDAYLKANGQTDGTASYGRMVDLLLAEWRAKNGGQ